MAGSITLSSSGAFVRTESKLKLMSGRSIEAALAKYGQLGVHVLQQATPQDTGDTRASWTSKVTRANGKFTIEWHNTNKTSTGQPIAILIQYGHGTGTGGYVPGKDYINPAIKPVFDLILAEIRQKVGGR